uniref:Photosystem II oxygen evolving complex protein PsbP n=1 Tax=Cyanothece sp. (strain PCC 7425 / ATCC 29141) TaxID=395961 RepID=B8HJK6_CYAP4
MLKRITLVALLILGLLLPGCSGGSGLKVYVDSIDGYEFAYPNGWVAVQVSSGADVVFRDLIQTTENVSVVVSQVSGEQSLADLGKPEEVGQRLAQRVIAPPESGRQADLISATSRQTDHQTYYNLEYVIRLPQEDPLAQQRHNLASVAVSRGKLYTLSVSTPEERWSRIQNRLEEMVNSFTVY